jgi:5-formyltetrahydrofolate cyclo-ligase
VNDKAELDLAKQKIRQLVWELMDREGVSPPSAAHSRIPFFDGAEAAAARLAALPVWHDARVVKANPDWAQLPVRVTALKDGKLLYMAVPRMADIRPFYVLDPPTLPTLAEQAGTPDVAADIAPKVSIDQMRPIDLIICGSVAVNPDGVRIGKGAGYSDIEVALLAEAGLIGPRTTIVTTVHRCQVLTRPLPSTSHDFTVDLIVTPDEVIACPTSRYPQGLRREDLDPDQAAAIPLLANRFGIGGPP